MKDGRADQDDYWPLSRPNRPGPVHSHVHRADQRRHRLLYLKVVRSDTE